MRGSTLSDDTLVAGMGAGDECAGVTFVRRYQARVYGLALKMLGDPVLAQDVAQEAFLRVWRHAARVRPPPGLSQRVGLHDHPQPGSRCLAAAGPVVIDPSDPMWANLVSKAPRPDEQAESSEMRDRLLAALASRPAEQSRALVLAAVYGYTAAEISGAEAIPLGTAKTSTRRGLLKLLALALTHHLAS